MGFGERLWSLWQLRLGVALSFVIALGAAAWSLGEVRVLPPGFTPRALELGAASTQVVVDTPQSTLIDLRRDTYSFEGLRNRSVLLGNVMASLPVRQEIAKAVGVPVEVLQVAAPRTPEQPRAVVGAGAERHTTDILKSNDQYRLSIQANPTVPILDIYAQAPSAATATKLADAAVDALTAHLDEVASTEATPKKDQIRLMQLGRARGGVINGSIDWQAPLLAFVLTFGVACATVVLIARIKQGWKIAALAEQQFAE